MFIYLWLQRFCCSPPPPHLRPTPRSPLRPMEAIVAAGVVDNGAVDGGRGGLGCHCLEDTLQEINTSHLGKRKIIFKMDFSGDMLVPRRIIPRTCEWSICHLSKTQLLDKTFGDIHKMVSPKKFNFLFQGSLERWEYPWLVPPSKVVSLSNGVNGL